MIRKDYIMRMIHELVMMVRAGLRLPEEDAGALPLDIERAVGDAVKIDHDIFFSLDPESMVMMLDMGEVDQALGTYVVHAIVLEATLLEADGHMALAGLRREQARAIAGHLGCAEPLADATTTSLEAFFMEDPGVYLRTTGLISGVDNQEGRQSVAPVQKESLVLNGSMSQSEMSRFKF